MIENKQHEKLPTGFIDIHCHCLPELDDGPRNIYESLALCQALVDDGITVVIATPHQLGQFDGCNNTNDVRNAVLRLNKELENNKIKLSVMPGGDVRIDERICEFIKEDKIQTLADGGKYILLELPSRILIDIESLLIELAEMNIFAILSHPERHSVLCRQYNIIPKWLRRNAYLQITAGSLTGDFGLNAQKAAWDYLSMGWVSFVATDAHNIRSRRPLMKKAYQEICSKFGSQIAHIVCIENPMRLLEGRQIESVLINQHQRIYDDVK